MTHRERVICAITHNQVDRVPFDFWAEPATIARLCSFYGTRDLDEVLGRLGVDIRHLNAAEPPEQDCGDFIQNFWGERYIYKDTPWGPVREDMPGALSGATDIAELRDFDWPSPADFDYSGIGPACDRYDGCALMYGFADIWQRPCLVRGMANALADLYVNPDWMHFLSRTFTGFYLADYANAFRASGGRLCHVSLLWHGIPVHRTPD